ncbi:MAG: iron-containing redox enzyme family protein [Pseudomonadota bacterium]
MKKQQIDTLRAISFEAIRNFSENRVIEAIKDGAWKKSNYEALLLAIHPQVYQGTMSFALAAGNCATRHTALREFLVRHAEEEMLHYQWIEDDLRSIGYEGRNPKEVLPNPHTQAYIAFNFYNAHHFPPSRLASSLVLEGLGASLKAEDLLPFLEREGLTPANFSFFLSHAKTDKEHIEELWSVISSVEFDEIEFEWVAHACRTAGYYYKAMYDGSMDYRAS